MSKPAIIRQVWNRRFGLRVQSFSVLVWFVKDRPGLLADLSECHDKGHIIRIASTFGKGQFRWMW